jgi:ABC-type multidrug transport system fused ATPase/permease subunit
MLTGWSHIILLFRLVGWRLVLLVAIGFFAALFEAFGVAAFLPLVEGDDRQSRMGEVITAVLDWVGIGTGLGVVLILLGFMVVARGLALWSQTAYYGRIRGDFLINLRTRAFRQIFNADYTFYTQQELGRTANVVSTEYDRLSASISVLMMLTIALFFSAFYIVFPLFLSPVITLVALGAGAPLVILMIWANSKSVSYSVEITDQTNSLQQFIIQTLSNYRYLKITASNMVIVRELNETSRRLSHAIRKHHIVLGAGTHGFTPVVAAVIFGLLYVQVSVLDTPLFEAIFILFLLRRAMDQFVAAQSAYRAFLTYQGSYRAYRDLDGELELNKEPPRRIDGAEPDFDQEIQIDNVRYRYPGRDFSLKDISLTIAPKTTVAFVGASGSGKSTVGLLLAGVLHPDSGRVTLNSTDIHEFDQDVYRGSIGYVTQESVIFNDSVKHNINLWVSEKGDAALHAAAGLARVDEFIEDMPDGYDTTLGDYGALISGGQRQRIALARELYKEVKLLVLDEATSALDSNSETAIQHNIDDLRGGQTIVIITHRLSTIRNADLVCFFENGELVDQGRYEELYERETRFRRMVDLQGASPGSRNAT